MKIFVTGVCGQLGHDVVNNAIDRGYEVVGSDIQPIYSGVADGSTVCIFRGGGAACPAWREPRVRTRRSHPFGTNVIQRLLSHRPLASTCRVLHQWP